MTEAKNGKDMENDIKNDQELYSYFIERNVKNHKLNRNIIFFLKKLLIN